MKGLASGLFWLLLAWLVRVALEQWLQPVIATVPGVVLWMVGVALYIAVWALVIVVVRSEERAQATERHRADVAYAAQRREDEAAAAARTARRLAEGICPVYGTYYWPDQEPGEHCPNPDCPVPVVRPEGWQPRAARS
jgi:hypothetical protein